MGRFFLSSLAIVVIAIVAAAGTEASLVLSTKQTTTVEPKSKSQTPKVTTTPQVTPAPTPVVTTPEPVTPTPTTPTVPTTPTATINGYVHMRAQPTTAAAIVTDLYQGYTVSYTSEDSGDWQAITYQGQAGYVYKAYLNY